MRKLKSPKKNTFFSRTAQIVRKKITTDAIECIIYEYEINNVNIYFTETIISN